eukprot:Platyproteum_vivax@DN14852_c0_g1_i2.p1
MKYIQTSNSVKIPSDVKVMVKSRKVTVEGKHGKLERCFTHFPVDIAKSKNDDALNFTVWHGKSQHLAGIHTLCSHVNNMITGVRKLYRYKMRFVYAHFPINAKIADDGSNIEIRNFLGQKRARVINMLPQVKVDKTKEVKDEITLTG